MRIKNMIKLDTELKHRLYSFLWRLGGMIAVALIGFLIDNETALAIPAWLIVILGLVMGECSKFINNYSQKNK
jgi:hypothetical protein